MLKIYVITNPCQNFYPCNRGSEMLMRRRITSRWIGNMAVVTLMVITVIFSLSLNHQYQKSVSVDDVPTSIQVSSLNVDECKPPEMTLENSQINNFFKNDMKVDCSDAVPNWIYLSYGKIVYNKTVIANLKLKNIQCMAIFFRRSTDDTNKFLTPIEVNDGFVLRDKFFNITCTAVSRGKNVSYHNWHSGVARNEKIFERLNKLRDQIKEPKWNVYFIGFDSTSRLTFLRKFPNSYKYLTETLKIVVLKRHNIVGDGTPQALLPMLTGQTELELPNTKRRDKNAKYVNVYPFIWYNFSSSGYATLYAEDAAIIGTFSLRMTGFKESPVDHYTRNFWISAYKGMKEHPSQCLGSQPLVTVHLEQFRQFFEVYQDYPKYLFTISSVGHDDNNKLGHADNLLLEHLMQMKASGHLNKTIVVVYGDHGARFSHVRQTFDGKMEERLPFFGVVLPEAFREQHPEATANLQLNSERLTTHFDVYPTILSLLTGIQTDEGSVKDRGISLFRKIPSNRQCDDAGIEPHWCTCLKWQPVSVEDLTAIKITNDIIDAFNVITEEFRNYCVPLRLNELKLAFKMAPHTNLLNYEWVKDEDGFVPRYKANYTKVTKLVYQVMFDTSPGHNVYEVSANYDVTEKKSDFNPKTVGVLNRYYPNGFCIHEKDLLKEKFCSCRK